MPMSPDCGKCRVIARAAAASLSELAVRLKQYGTASCLLQKLMRRAFLCNLTA